MNNKISEIAAGHFAAKATINLEAFGQFVGDSVDRLRQGKTLTDIELGALECIAGQLIGEALLTRSMCG